MTKACFNTLYLLLKGGELNLNIKDTLKTAKLHESTISMILGAVVIVIVGVLLVNYFSSRQGQTVPPVEITDQSQTNESNLPTTHTVTEGEGLWSISEKYYGSGYNWIDIAEANNITDPDSITAGQQLIIPNVEPRLAQNVTLSPTKISEEVITPAASPTPTPEPTQTPQLSEKGEYAVNTGDNLWKIAEAQYGSGYNWVDIAQANNLENPGHIEVGQELLIPDVTERQPTTIKTASNEVANPISGDSYTVEKGDNLWDIAVRAYGDGYRWTEIASNNNLDNPSIIHQGNTLTIPR